ncbi:glucose-1-phosphate cytidylyltransferase [Dankookia rubra]|uniref:Glucose-1-phosphate cytidylyltransferase n=1 Tax=Dankookia rubra TaxID=1442381 RepID=A0A4V3AA62_9PROT|nr:glucose-1-phosphate cytidylyltransferase [Dankookia rubra]TDH61895.1 glucose-1-phosphate cytidylyltransferase [Dankookia rubra]
MKAVILAGGRGTRISEETSLRPKPMVEIGGWPILWHIMKIYAAHGVTDFVVCLGHKGWQIKEYFLNYRLHASDLSIDLASGRVDVLRPAAEPWRIALVDTGEDSMTGGRLKRIAPYVVDEPAFCMTYGDGLSDVDIGALIEFHRAHGRQATVTAVTPPGRFGALAREGAAVEAFVEKPAGDGGTINGGFFVLSPKVLGRIEGDATTWEAEPLQSLARDGELMAYDHKGFWQAMDTLRDRDQLERLWASGRAPWRQW